MSVEAPPKETKAQRAERLKSVKNPWECLDEIRNFASHGYSSIPDEWIKTYFRWWGVYTQGDGAGVVGGGAVLGSGGGVCCCWVCGGCAGVCAKADPAMVPASAIVAIATPRRATRVMP